MVLFYEELSSHEARTFAIKARLSPSADRKLLKILISFVFRFFAIMQDNVLAKVTNSQPEGQLQEFIISPDLLYERNLEIMNNSGFFKIHIAILHKL